MTIKKKLLSVAVSIGLVFGFCPASALAEDSSLEPEASSVQVDRIAGDTASHTSAAISSKTFAASEWIILARDDDFADAMSATGLAGVLDAPIILTDRNNLSDEARKEITRLGATQCLVIGGNGAMPGKFEDIFEGMRISEERIFGETAADTSVACANRIATIKQEMGQPLDKAIVAMSSNFQDALSISSFAYAYGVPIFLETSGATAADRELTSDARAALTGAWSGAQIYVPGGQGALSQASVEGVVGENRVVRMYGETGYDTSAAIAKRLTDDGLLSAANVYFACGAQASKGLDALSGAARAGKNKGVMLLTNGNAVMESLNMTTQYGFFVQHATEAQSVTIFGGTYVVPDSQMAAMQDILDNPLSVQPDILLGSFYSSDADHTTTVFGSVDTDLSDGLVMNALSSCSPLNHGNGGLVDPSIIYKDGYFWMLSGWNRNDGKIWVVISYSKDLVNWTSPEGDMLLNGTHGIPVDSYPNSQLGANFDTVAPEWFVDDDGTVYIVVSCGYYGAFHGQPTVDTMTPYMIKVNKLSANDPVSPCGDGYYWPNNLSFETGVAQKLISVTNQLGGEASPNIIDGSLYKENGTYYLTVKNQGLWNKTFVSTNPMANNWQFFTDLSSEYEGASIAKFDSQYLLFGDKVVGATAVGVDFASSGSISFMNNWRAPLFRDLNNNPMTVRHGSVITLKQGTPGWRVVSKLMVSRGLTG